MPSTASLTANKIGRPNRAVSDRLDKDLLDLAAGAFRDSKFEDASLEGLAARIGVSKPTLYRRFGSRSALLEAIVERQLALLLQPEGDKAPEGDPLAKLRSYARGLFRRFLDPGTTNFVRFLIHEGAATPRLTLLRGQWHRQVMDHLHCLIAEAQTRGAFGSDSPQALANLLIDLVYTPITLRLMAFEDAEILSAMTPEAFFTWRFTLFETLAGRSV
jgi:AcrR family transcriptional regulator